MKTIASIFAAAGIALFALLVIPAAAFAATCDFTRDLTLGVEGEDVRCLQQYLNGAGFTVASEGVGSAGHETTQFKTLTQAAVVKWQSSNGITPASGYFGPISRQMYLTLVSGS